MTADATADGPARGSAEVRQLSHLMPALWRALTRATKAAEMMPAIESQVSILRRLVEVDRSSPAQLAEELHLARPTISNLLRDLVRDGLVERHPSPSDGRSVDVVATPYGREVLEAFRRGRVEVLADALDALPSGDRTDIATALQPLERLLERLERMAEAEFDESATSAATTPLVANAD